MKLPLRIARPYVRAIAIFQKSCADFLEISLQLRSVKACRCNIVRLNVAYVEFGKQFAVTVGLVVDLFGC